LNGGRVILTRYGLGGTKIKVETVLPAGHAKTEEEKKLAELLPTVHRYEFAEFCLALRSAAKAFVPLVGTCVVSMKHGIRNVPQDETDQYLEREKILNNLLKHQTLHNAVKTIKKYLVQGVIPGSELPAMFRKRREEKLRLKQQQATEYDNIYKFLQNNVPEDFELAKAQAQKLNEESERQRELERDERKKAYEARLANKPTNKSAGKGEESTELGESPKERLKKKVVKEKDTDGFVIEKVYIIEKDGKLKASVAKEVKKKVAPVVKKEHKPVDSEFENNPYAAAMLQGSFTSIADDLHEKNMSKAQNREQAEERKRSLNQKKDGQKKKGTKATTTEECNSPTSQDTKPTNFSEGTNAFPPTKPTEGST